MNEPEDLLQAALHPPLICEECEQTIRTKGGETGVILIDKDLHSGCAAQLALDLLLNSKDASAKVKREALEVLQVLVADYRRILPQRQPVAWAASEWERRHV
jgi:hypothetical protein